MTGGVSIAGTGCPPEHHGAERTSGLMDWPRTVREASVARLKDMSNGPVGGPRFVLDSNVQTSKDPLGQRESLSAVNHDVPQIFAALDF